uniref:Uncharacterized protein n=1 Tax=Cacopsylla melanoneura TaxID=428564 RepID=A0A8D9BRN4_9HEMI
MGAKSRTGIFRTFCIAVVKTAGHRVANNKIANRSRFYFPRIIELLSDTLVINGHTLCMTFFCTLRKNRTGSGTMVIPFQLKENVNQIIQTLINLSFQVELVQSIVEQLEVTSCVNSTMRKFS